MLTEPRQAPTSDLPPEETAADSTSIPTDGRRISVDWIVVLALFTLALVLRVWGVWWSLPYVIHPDEPNLVDAGVHIIKTGDLNPHFFDYPSLFIYLQTVVYWLNLLWGTWQGYYAGPQSLPDQNFIFALAPQLYLWGRTFSALIGALTIAGVYGLGKAMFGRAAGLVAAILLLTSPLHIEQSHYLVTDTAMTAMAVATLAASWRLANQPGVRIALLAGVLAGLTAAIKYNGGYVILVAAIAWGLAWRVEAIEAGSEPSAMRRLLPRWLALGMGMVASAGAAFLLTNPFVLLDWAHWSRAFSLLVDAGVPSHSIADIVSSIVRQVDALANDWAILWSGILGGLLLLWAVVSKRNARMIRAVWLLAPFPPIYILLMSDFTGIYPRYMIITLPFLALLGGFAWPQVGQWLVYRMSSSAPRLLRQPGILSSLMCFLLVAVPTYQMINFDRYMAAPDSRNLAFSWLLQELRAGHRAAVELQPWMLCAPTPWPCPAPDVYAPLQQLTNHPPSWYADRGYDYVMLLGEEKAVLENPDVSGPRTPHALASYLELPQPAHFDGDHEGGKGPPVLVFRTAPKPLDGIKGVTRLGVQFGDVAELWGYASTPLASVSDEFDPAVISVPVDNPKYKVGQALGLKLYWHSLKDGTDDTHNWTVAVHLSDQAGAVVAQVDVLPLSSGRSRPVHEWYINEFLAGDYSLALPATLTPGIYRLTVNIYDAPAGPPLPATLSGAEQLGGADLGEIVVEK